MATAQEIAKARAMAGRVMRQADTVVAKGRKAEMKMPYGSARHQKFAPNLTTAMNKTDDAGEKIKKITGSYAPRMVIGGKY